MRDITEIIHSLQSYELQPLNDIQVHPQCYYDLVTIIREHKDVFPAWHSSLVAELYTPKVFQNKKIIRLLVISGFFCIFAPKYLSIAKMRKFIYTIIVLNSFYFLCSCSNNSSAKTDKQEIDTLWNEKIQNVFFEVPFGANKEEVVAMFSNHGLMKDEQYSTDISIHFRNTTGRYFTFGGLNWELLTVNFSNGKFNAIEFMNYSEDKASALETFNTIKSTVSKKYDLTDIAPEDTTVYARSIAFGKDERMLGIFCFRYETVLKEIKIGVTLDYIDNSIGKDASDEL